MEWDGCSAHRVLYIMAFLLQAIGDVLGHDTCLFNIDALEPRDDRQPVDAGAARLVRR